MDQQTNKDVAWLKMCQVGAQVMAKCSKAQYMSYVIDSDGRVRGCGYNGTPSGFENCVDGGCPRAVNMVPPGTPYDHGPGLCLAIHAEMNAILGLDRKILQESTVYVNGICCFGCAKGLVGSGVKRVVGITANVMVDHEVTQRLFENAGVDWVLYHSNIVED
jgi:dCMP deaminase